MGRRLELQAILEDICDRVYYQPPSNIQMSYPCIVYNRDSAKSEFADNSPYRYTQRYSLTIIDRNPDGPILDLVRQLPLTTYNRGFRTDGLNHDVFTIYF